MRTLLKLSALMLVIGVFADTASAMPWPHADVKFRGLFGQSNRDGAPLRSRNLIAARVEPHVTAFSAPPSPILEQRSFSYTPSMNGTSAQPRRVLLNQR